MDGAVRFFQAGSRGGCGRPTRPIELTGGLIRPAGRIASGHPWWQSAHVCALRGACRRRRWCVWRGAALSPWFRFKSSFTYVNTPGFSLWTKVISVGAADGFGRALTIAKLKCWCCQFRRYEHGRGARLVSELAGWLSCPPFEHLFGQRCGSGSTESTSGLREGTASSLHCTGLAIHTPATVCQFNFQPSSWGPL